MTSVTEDYNAPNDWLPPNYTLKIIREEVVVAHTLVRARKDWRYPDRHSKGLSQTAQFRRPAEHAETPSFSNIINFLTTFYSLHTAYPFAASILPSKNYTLGRVTFFPNMSKMYHWKFQSDAIRTDVQLLLPFSLSSTPMYFKLGKITSLWTL